MTIYLVEDDATIAGAVASHLRAWGYDCVVAADFRDVAGESDNLNILTAIQMGGDDFLAKPFDLNILAAKVQALLRRAYDFAPPSDVLACGALRLNLSDGTVEQGGQRTTLTRNELKILQVLLENRGKIVSRDRLMERLWESDSFVDENTLTVNVNRLRKTLAAVGAGDLIVTRKKQGYLVP